MRRRLGRLPDPEEVARRSVGVRCGGRFRAKSQPSSPIAGKPLDVRLAKDRVAAGAVEEYEVRRCFAMRTRIVAIRFEMSNNSARWVFQIDGKPLRGREVAYHLWNSGRIEQKPGERTIEV